MPASPFDNAIYRDLFGDAEVGNLFSATAEVRAMMLVQGTLAKVQGTLGIIPEISGAAIHRASLELQIDPGGLSKATGQNGVVVPALVTAFRAEMKAPEHAQYLHWGATSQDVMDTGLILRLRAVVAIYDLRLRALVRTLGGLASQHADLAMVARTYGQAATPTSFGAVVASWGAPLIRHLDRLDALSPGLLQVSLSGAAGTLSVMGPQGGLGAQLRADFATALNLNDPGSSWHSMRDTIAEFSAWMTLVNGSIAKMGADLIAMTQSGIDEVTLSNSGASSTMPQKSNPILPSLLVALADQTTALNGTIQGALIHRQQRDGAAWINEWIALPQICMATARTLRGAQELAGGLHPNAERMAGAIDATRGLIFAEALSFALSAHMPRPKAQAATKALCQQVSNGTKTLGALAAQTWPDIDFKDLFDANGNLGQAPVDARNFAARAKTI
jgi:3-carboxy-cis,cis-muconate cycloisomerase